MIIVWQLGRGEGEAISNEKEGLREACMKERLDRVRIADFISIVTTSLSLRKHSLSTSLKWCLFFSPVNECHFVGIKIGVRGS